MQSGCATRGLPGDSLGLAALGALSPLSFHVRALFRAKGTGLPGEPGRAGRLGCAGTTAMRASYALPGCWSPAAGDR